MSLFGNTNKVLEKSIDKSFVEFSENILSLSEQGIIAADSKNLIIPFEEYIKKSSSMRHISVNSLNHTTISYKYKAIFDFNSRKTVSLHGKLDYLTDDLVKWQKENKTVVILAKNRSRAENITGILNDKGINAKYIKNNSDFAEGEISVAAGEINKGFEYPDIGFVLICEQEIFNTEKRRQRRRIDNTKRIKAYTDINIGDYVVHQAH